MRTLIIAAGVFLFCVTSVQAEEQKEFDFAGVKSCKKCHRKVWKTWKDSTMALSFDILKPGERAEVKKKAGLDPQKDYTQDATCLPCHTTGYGKTGGFVSMEKTPSMAGVSCEACHGPGKEYNKVMKKHSRTYTEEEILHAGLIKDPHATCTNCHNENSPTRKFQDPFDAQLHEWPGHDPVKLKYHTPEYQTNK
ncbi:MAG: cytochrome c family protein [Thermodesulfobacteriota bacterium]|nr:cytochrome c family protein [Thermodesulfobacteriota bacterium]